MSSKEKLQLINYDIEFLNTTFLSSMQAKLSFSTKGKGRYCLSLVYKKKELKDTTSEFHTYDDVMHALDVFINIYNRALYERKTFKKGGDK